MSTRAMLDFVYSWDAKKARAEHPDIKVPEDDNMYTDGKRIYRVEARIYNHYDGYPEGLGAEILRFFRAVERQTKDRRYGDAEYFAAKWVVWKSQGGSRQDEDGPGKDKPLDFLGVGIGFKYHGDLEFVYRIDTAQHDEKGRPLVTYAKYSGFGGVGVGKFRPLPKAVVDAVLQEDASMAAG